MGLPVGMDFTLPSLISSFGCCVHGVLLWLETVHDALTAANLISLPFASFLLKDE